MLDPLSRWQLGHFEPACHQIATIEISDLLLLAHVLVLASFIPPKKNGSKKKRRFIFFFLSAF